MILDDFYTVSAHKAEGDTKITKLQVNAAHEIFQGHFPSRPVTPGVVLMQLFKEEVERRTKKNLQLVRANNVKFIAVFDPNINKELVLESNLEETEGFVRLKGIAKTKDGLVLKIDALYKII